MAGNYFPDPCFGSFTMFWVKKKWLLVFALFMNSDLERRMLTRKWIGEEVESPSMKMRSLEEHLYSVLTNSSKSSLNSNPGKNLFI